MEMSDEDLVLVLRLCKISRQFMAALEGVIDGADLFEHRAATESLALRARDELSRRQPRSAEGGSA